MQQYGSVHGVKKIAVVMKYRATIWLCSWGEKNCCCHEILCKLSTSTLNDNLRPQPAFGRLRNIEYLTNIFTVDLRDWVLAGWPGMFRYLLLNRWTNQKMLL